MSSYHFIGIGGVGMSGLADILLQKGNTVSGSDVVNSFITRQLNSRGVNIYYEHKEENIGDCDVVVYNTMIDLSNPELSIAKKNGKVVLHRSELLKLLMNDKKSIIVCGSHGKTTVTALAAYILDFCNIDPSYLIGGFSKSLKSNGKNGKSCWFVAEGDESDSSFLKTNPHGAIVTNFDFDHLSFWKTKDRLIDGFKKFISMIENEDMFFYYGDDPILSNWNLNGVSFGLSSKSYLRATNIKDENGKSIFDITFGGKVYKNFILNMIGEHNVINGLCAFGLAMRLGCNDDEVKKALASFSGVHRRVEFKGEVGGIAVYDDYAHHPNEVKEIVNTFNKIAGSRRLVIIFQPHRYSRTYDMQDEFVDVLSKIDNLFLTDIYGAFEENIHNISIDILLNKIPKAKYLHINNFAIILKDYIKQNDIIVTVGAGDVTKIGNELLSLLRNSQSIDF